MIWVARVWLALMWLALMALAVAFGIGWVLLLAPGPVLLVLD